MVFINETPRKATADSFPSMNSAEKQDCYAAEDFMVGRTVNILGQEFFIYDMDEFSRRFYVEVMGEQAVEGMDSGAERGLVPNTMVVVPPHAGPAVGTLDDSLQNCLSLAPRQPRKDVRRLLEKAGQTLRYSAQLESVLPADSCREFVLTFFLQVPVDYYYFYSILFPIFLYTMHRTTRSPFLSLHGQIPGCELGCSSRAGRFRSRTAALWTAAARSFTRWQTFTSGRASPPSVGSFG